MPTTLNVKKCTSIIPNEEVYLLPKEGVLVAFYCKSYPRVLCRQAKKFSSSVTRLGDLLDFGQLFEAFGSN